MATLQDDRGASYLHDLAVFSLGVVYFLVVLAIDRWYWPGHNLPILYAVPLLYAALNEPPEFVGALSLVAVALDILSSVTAGYSPHPWPLTAGALAAIGGLSIIIAGGRHRAADRERQRQELILLVQDLRQPLTVILGRVQLARMFKEVPIVVEASLETIERNARRLERIIADVLNNF